MSNKYKNYGLWISLASLLFMILNAYGIGIQEEEYNIIITTILSVLIALGVISNPEAGKGFGDKT